MPQKALAFQMSNHRADSGIARWIRQPLQHIADTTGGRYFRATDADGLRDVFATIDELEKSEIESKVRVIYSELFPDLLAPTLLLLLLDRLLLATRLRRLP